MVSDLRKKTMSDVARELGIDPFEVVRLLVVTGSYPTVPCFTDEQVAHLRGVAGIETWWAADTELPADDNVRRRAIRALVGQILSRGVIGENRARLDNLWRGLLDEDQQLLESAVGVLIDEGHLVLVQTAAGMEVSASAESVSHLEALQAGDVNSPALAALCGE